MTDTPAQHDTPSATPLTSIDVLVDSDDESFAELLPVLMKPGPEGRHLAILDNHRIAERFLHVADPEAVALILDLAQEHHSGLAVLFTDTVLDRLNALPARTYRGVFLPGARKIRGFAGGDLREALKERKAKTTARPRGVPANGASPKGHVLTVGESDWQEPLLNTPKGDPKENMSNVSRILRHHPAWKGRLWWDEVRSSPMLDTTPIKDTMVTQIAEWLGDEMHMHTTKPSMIERCIVSVSQDSPRDLLREWLEALPPWDGVVRLDDWLGDIASVEKNVYGMTISRLLPVSMVARALDPGCIYRYVVIFEGEENTGKSDLVRTLASPEWYFAMTRDFESKEAHMDIQGAWVAELPELDSLGRTQEPRLKAFITLREDSWIPKYANHRITSLRRTIFVGTINPEDPYLKGRTGNTRFLPIKTGAIDVQMLREIREQLFAEAMMYYRDNPDSWWQMSDEALEAASKEREERRAVNEYEDLLRNWLRNLYAESMPPTLRTATTWQEIAEGALGMTKAAEWRDKAQQMTVASAMHSLGWIRRKKRLTPGSPPVWAWLAPKDWEQRVRGGNGFDEE